MDKDTRYNLRSILFVTVIGALVGIVYTQVVYASRPDAIGNLWVGLFIGAILSCLSTTFEVFIVSRPDSHLRRLSFLQMLFIRTIVHLSIIIFANLLVQFSYNVITGTQGFVPAEQLGDTTTDIGFSFLVLVFIIFWMQMRSFIGARTLNNLILGKYHKPQIEERIFMIVDISGSTLATQQIGDRNFHRYLNRLFILFDYVIHKYGGEVHSYVGDAIFVMWPLENDARLNARPFQALREMKALCARKNNSIKDEFGLEPRFRAAIHAGPIVVGEMGDRKRQITYLGNTLNLTSRLEGLSKEMDIPFLVSGDVLSRTKAPRHVTFRELGEKAVKGSVKKLEVFEIVIEA